MTTLTTPPRQLLAQAFEVIPSHQEEAQPIDSLQQKLFTLSGQPKPATKRALFQALGLLESFGGLRKEEHNPNPKVRSSSAQADYFLRSVGLWVGQSSPEETLVSSPVVRAIETERVLHAKKMGIVPEPARRQTAVFVLIKKEVDGQPCFCFQFDSKAKQYQFIGGKIEKNEAAEEAAYREFEEEIGEFQPSPFQRGTDVQLRSLIKKPFVFSSISSSYGVLTEYTFYLYYATLGKELRLEEADTWIPQSTLLAGQLHQGYSIGEPNLFRKIDAEIEGGLASLPYSIAPN